MCTFCSDSSSNKDAPAILSTSGEEPFKSGTGTFHPHDVDASSITSDTEGYDDVFNAKPPADTYDRLRPVKVRKYPQMFLNNF